MKEEWRVVGGYPKILVSSLGNFLSVQKWGTRPLKICSNRYGYAKINLYSRTSPRKDSVHQVVARAFIPNPNGYPDVNHINGIKTDNRVCNLEWTNDSLNMRHSYKIGTHKPMKGEGNSRSKLSNEDVLAIRKDYCTNPEGYTSRLSARYGVSVGVISSVVKRRSWRHL